MKNLSFLFFYSFISFQGFGAQCHLIAPDSLRTVPHYSSIFRGDTVTFITYGGTGDSSSWFALYGEECCVTRLDSNKTGIFTFVVWGSDIFYSRIENYCDTTWGASIDIDAWPRISTDLTRSPDGDRPCTSVSPCPPHSRGEGFGQPIYDLLGREISEETKGFRIIKKRLFFK